MNPVFSRNSDFLIGMLMALSAQATLAEDGGVPEWLGGKPDVDIKTDRCGVYEWFFNEADSQTGGAVSKDDLASRRVINIANKLVDHHLSRPTVEYGAEIKYLVIGENGPSHFEFTISNDELERIMGESCSD